MAFTVTAPNSVQTGQTITWQLTGAFAVNSTIPTPTVTQLSGPPCILTASGVTMGADLNDDGTQQATWTISAQTPNTGDVTADTGDVLLNCNINTGEQIDVMFTIIPIPPPSNVSIPMSSFSITGP